MVDSAKTPENSRPKSLTAAAHAAGEFNRDAEIVSEMSAAGTLAVVIGKSLQNAVRPAGFKVYRDQVLKAGGDPSDPLESMLLEQVMIAHHRILSLHAEAARAETSEMIEVLNAAATKLTAEMRRLCLAVREYRAPIAPKNVTVVGQQNVARGNQQIAMVAKRPFVPAQNIETTVDSENQKKALTHEKAPLFDASVNGSKIPQIEETVPRSPGEWRNAIGL